jgi:uncharacterized cupredoxin-like copper-binding protein
MKQHFLFTAVSAFLLMLTLAACGRTGEESTTRGNATGGESATNSVQVTETEFKITSSVTSFTPGTAYHFVITNTGKTTHEFMIMPKSEGSMNGMPMSNMDKMALASIDAIAPGETKTLDYTFPSSSANSHPELVCYLPGHYEAGMKQDVTIKS